jgi:hypothetical protein
VVFTRLHGVPSWIHLAYCPSGLSECQCGASRPMLLVPLPKETEHCASHPGLSPARSSTDAIKRAGL